MAVAISSFSADCIRDNLPLLFLDTCSLLDILRFHVRIPNAQKANRNLSAIVELLNSTPSKLKIVAPIQVERELASNTETTINEASRVSEDFNEKTLVQAEVLHFLDSNYVVPVLPSSSDIKGKSKQLMEECVKKLIFLDENDDCDKKAMSRAISDTAPARQGGTVKDCIVLEHCLELAAQLRTSGHSNSIVFLSSNTADYCTGTSLALKAPIDEEFSALQITFTNSWEWALSVLGI